MHTKSNNNVVDDVGMYHNGRRWVHREEILGLVKCSIPSIDKINILIKSCSGLRYDAHSHSGHKNPAITMTGRGSAVAKTICSKHLVTQIVEGRIKSDCVVDMLEIRHITVLPVEALTLLCHFGGDTNKLVGIRCQ